MSLCTKRCNDLSKVTTQSTLMETSTQCSLDHIHIGTIFTLELNISFKLHCTTFSSRAELLQL